MTRLGASVFLIAGMAYIPSAWTLAPLLTSVINMDEVNRVLGHAEMAALLNEAGFEIVRTYWYGFLPRTGWYFPWLSKHCMAPVEWACSLLPFVPRSLAQSFIVVCRKAPARR